MSWTPDLAGRKGPHYRRIAEAISEDIKAGRLLPGDRLPTHRFLAQNLKLTVGTVARAYNEAQEAGFLTGAVGRGTFVSESAPQAGAALTIARPRSPLAQVIDLTQNHVVRAQHRIFLEKALQDLAQTENLVALVSTSPHAGHFEHREAGARWISEHADIEVTADQVFICNGGQHAIDIALRCSTKPGAALMVEALTYPGLKASAAALGLQLLPIEMDEYGLIPRSLDRTAAKSDARCLYLISTIHTATTATLVPERRIEIAEIARKRNLIIIEDGVFDPLVGSRLQPISALVPERSFYITSLAKTVSSVLHAGFLLVPPTFRDLTISTLRASCWSASPIASAIAARSIFNGSAHAMAQRNRDEAARRQEIARAAFANICNYASHENSYHGWLVLPAGRRPGEFIAAARASGVAVVPSEAFTITADLEPPRAVRISLICPDSLSDVRIAVEQIASLLSGAVSSVLSIV
jgi:DNA-binding transcriptional MocR family regulator